MSAAVVAVIVLGGLLAFVLWFLLVRIDRTIVELAAEIRMLRRTTPRDPTT